MKRYTIIAMILALALLLTACGVKDKVQDTVKDAVSGTKSDSETSSGGGETSSDYDIDADLSEEQWDALQEWAHAQGWDGEGYYFPQVDSVQEWPPASVWTELGLPDMTPDNMDNGEIYNDGNAHVDGFADVFIAQCDSDEEGFYALAQKLWDAGIKGVNLGNGHIVPAEEVDWLIEDNMNYLWYRGYYEHKGDIMQVYLQKTNGWSDTLWVGVLYAPSDPNYEQMPKISWPTSDIKTILGIDLPSPGGEIYGIADMGDYKSISLVIEGLSQADYDRYLDKLENGTAGLLLDENGSSWDFYGTYGYSFYHEDYENYPAYVDVNFASGALFISVIAL